MNLLKRLLQGDTGDAVAGSRPQETAAPTATMEPQTNAQPVGADSISARDDAPANADNAQPVGAVSGRPQAYAQPSPNAQTAPATKQPLSPAARKQKKQQLFRAINACKELLREPMLRAQEMQLLYRNGEAYQLLQSETRLLAAFPALLPDLNAHQQNQIENFELSLELLGEKKAELDAQLPPFLTRENALKADIQAFTKAVNETQSKHKLSPDWDGKKPTLMRLGAQLQERRAAYDKDEEHLNAKTEKLYALHAEFYQEFSLFCEEILPLLEAEFKAVT